MRSFFSPEGFSSLWPALSTVLFFLLFVGIVALIYLPTRRRRYQELAKLPLQDEPVKKACCGKCSNPEYPTTCSGTGVQIGGSKV